VRSGLVHQAPDPAGPCPASSLTSHPRSAGPIPWRRFWAATSERGSPARDELPSPTIEPGGPTRHASHQLLNSTWPAPGSNCSRRTLTVLTRPAGHRRRRARNPTRQLPRAGGPCQRGRGSPGRASPSGELVPTRQAHERRPRRPCHYRAIHSGPGWSPADNHGHRHSDLDLRRFVQSQVTNRAIWLCKQVIGLSRPRPHGGTTSRTPAACTAAPGTDRSSCSPITPRTRSPPTASPS
jgi:hypothetical protein